MPQIHLIFAGLVICIVIPRILAKPLEDLKEPAENATYNDETRSGEPQILSANLLEKHSEVDIENPSENENSTKHHITRMSKSDTVPTEQITDFNTKVPCDNAQFLLKILTVMLPLLRNEVPSSTRTSYILLILKDLLKSSPEAAENDEILYKINDLIITLDKYHNNDLESSHTALRNLGDSVSLPNGIKSEIVFKYEIPQLPNPNCNSELFKIIDNVQKAILKLVNNPICQSKTPLELPFFIKFDQDYKKPDQYMQLPNQNDDFEVQNYYPNSPYQVSTDVPTVNSPVLSDNMRDEDFLYPKNPKKTPKPIFGTDFPELTYPEFQYDNPIKVTSSPAYDNPLFSQTYSSYPVKTDPHLLKNLDENPKNPLFGFDLPLKDDKPTFNIWTNSETTPYFDSFPGISYNPTGVSPYPLIRPGQKKDKNKYDLENNLYPNGPKPYDGINIPYRPFSQNLDYPDSFDSSKPTDDILLPYSPIGQSPDLYNFYPMSSDSTKPSDVLNLPYRPSSQTPDLFNMFQESPYITKPSDDLPYRPSSQTPDLFNMFQESPYITKPSDDLPYRPSSQSPDLYNIDPESLVTSKPNNDLYLPYIPLDQTLDLYNIHPESYNGSRPIDDFYLPYRPFEQNSDLYNINSESFDSTKPNDGIYTYRPIGQGSDLYNIDPSSPSSTKPTYNLYIPFQPYNPLKKTKNNPISYDDVEPENNPTQPTYDQWSGSLHPNNLNVYGIPNSAYIPLLPINTQESTTPVSFVKLPDIENDILYKPTESTKNKDPISIQSNSNIYYPYPGSEIHSSNYPQEDKIPLDYLLPSNKPPLSADINQLAPSPKLKIVGFPESAYIPIGAPDSDVYIINPTKKPNEPNKYDSLPSSRPLIKGKYLPNGPSNFRPNEPNIQTPNGPFLQPFDYETPDKPLLPFDISRPDQIGLNPTTETPTESIYLPMQPQMPSYPYDDYLSHILPPSSPNSSPDVQGPYDNEDYNNGGFDLYPFLPKDNKIISPDSVTKPPWLPYIDNQYPINFENNIPQQGTYDPDYLPEINTPVLLDDINPTQDFYQPTLTPDNNILLIIKDNIKKMEQKIPKEYLNPALLEMITKLKKLLDLEQITVEEYVNIIHRYQIIIDHVKNLNLGDELMKDLLLSMTNLNKLDLQSGKSKVIEFTYLVKRPKPLIYQPYYYVKYRLPYNSFLTHIDRLLAANPYLKDQPAELYKALISTSKVTETSPDLKDFGKEDILKLTFNKGTLVGAKVTKSKDVGLYKMLDQIKDINTELSIDDVYRLINNLDAHLKHTSNGLSREENDFTFYHPDEKNKEILIKVKKPILQKVTKITTNKLATDQIIRDILNNNHILRSSEHNATSENYSKLGNYSSLIGKTIDRYDLNPLRYLGYAMTKDIKPNKNTYDKNPNIYELHKDYSKVLNDFDYHPMSNIAYKPKLTSAGSSDWKLYSNPTQYEKFPISPKDTNWMDLYGNKQNTAIPFRQKPNPEVISDWELYSNPTQYEKYPNSIKETKWVDLNGFKQDAASPRKPKLKSEVNNDWKLYHNPLESKKHSSLVKETEWIDLNGFKQDGVPYYMPKLTSEVSNDWKLYPNPSEYEQYSSSVKETKKADFNGNEPLAKTFTSKVTTYEQPNEGYPIVEPVISEPNLNVGLNTQLHPVTDAKLLEATLKADKNYKSPDLTSINIASNTQLDPITGVKLLKNTLGADNTLDLLPQKLQFDSPQTSVTVSEITGNPKAIESHIVKESKTYYNGIPVEQAKSYLIDKGDGSEKQYETSQLDVAANSQYDTEGKLYNKNNYNSLDTARPNGKKTVNSETQYKTYTNTNNLDQNLNLDSNSYIGNTNYYDNGVYKAALLGNQAYSLNSGFQPYLAGNAYNYNMANSGWNFPYNLNLANKLLIPRYRYIHQRWPTVQRLIRPSRFLPHPLVG